MKIKSFAKINLGLEVLSRRPDGYHDILTLFQSVDFADILEFSSIAGPDIILSGTEPSLPWDSTNLVYRAAELLRREAGADRGARIDVHKTVPTAKGLGGGSSNAAMTLYGLNILWGLGLNDAALIELGKKLGADVPYFLKGGLCLGEERGDKLTAISDLPLYFCLLVFPSFSIRTVDIYEAWRPHLTSEAKPSKITRFLENKDLSLLENQLEETIFRFYPQLEEYKRFFQRLGAELSLISGTGSTVFGLFKEEERALKGWAEFRKKAPSFLVKTLPRTEYENKLRAGV